MLLVKDSSRSCPTLPSIIRLYTLSTDLEKFLKGASKELEETFNSSCHFQKVYAALMKNVSLMTEQLTVARSDAQMWCHGKQQVTCTGIMSSKEICKLCVYALSGSVQNVTKMIFF